MAFLFVLISLLSNIAYAADSPIQIYNRTNSGNGSGFVFQQDSNISIIATNYHVCISNYEAMVDGKEKPKVGDVFIKYKGYLNPSKVIGLDRYNDVCFLKTKNIKYPKYSIATKFKETLTGTLVISAQHSNQMIYTSFGGKSRELDKWTDYHKNSFDLKGMGIPGDSGSPIIDNEYKVVGVYWGQSESAGYAVPIEEFWKVWNSLKLIRHLRVNEKTTITKYYDGMSYSLFRYE